VAALLERYSELPGHAERPGIVHRLDRSTSGLLVVARTPEAMKDLSRQIAARAVEREYNALVWGVPKPRSGTIDARISRSRRDRRRMAPSRERGRPAATDYRVVESWDIASLLELRLRTGRTHQIRVHLAHIGYPVIGDPDYGGRQKGLLALPSTARARGRALLAVIDRQALHARRLAFLHPVHGRPLEFHAPLPADFAACCDLLRPRGGGAAAGSR
jgi:23S rRNA pseudouridine1911/1915/1917 synthase